MSTNTPEGWHTLTPRLFTKDTKQLVDFLKIVFQAKGDFLDSRPTELKIGDSVIMISDVETRGTYSACLYVYVSSVEKTYERAISQGAQTIEEPIDTPYGDKRAIVKDQWGNMWQIAEYNSK